MQFMFLYEAWTLLIKLGALKVKKGALRTKQQAAAATTPTAHEDDAAKPSKQLRRSRRHRGEGPEQQPW